MQTKKNKTHVLEPIHIPRALNTGTCIQQGNLFILQAYTGTSVNHTEQGKKLGRGFAKTMQVNGPEGQKLARKESLAVSLACMAIYWSIPGFKGTTIKLCVLS